MRKSLIAPNYETYEYDPKMAFHSSEKQVSHQSNYSTGMTTLKGGKSSRPGAPMPKKKKVQAPNTALCNQRSQSYGPAFGSVHQSQQVLQKKPAPQLHQNPVAPKSLKLEKQDKSDLLNQILRRLDTLETFQDTCEKELIELHLKNQIQEQWNQQINIPLLKSEMMEFIDQKVRLMNISNSKTTIDENIEAQLNEEMAKPQGSSYKMNALWEKVMQMDKEWGQLLLKSEKKLQKQILSTLTFSK